ncbi:MAG: hypothetical protein DRN03_02135 [Thermoplasmata archaeon]|nr:MAG: hypothetical protein DRN03_02135 [Thermoplasmata archaeon]
MEREFRFKPGHFKILAALARKDGLRKEDLAKEVGDRTLAIKYRKELLRLGLISQDENDRFHLVAKSWELLYVYEVLKLFEEVVLKAKGTIIVKEPGVIHILDKSAPIVVGFNLSMESLSDFFEDVIKDGLSEDDKLLFGEILCLNNQELHRATCLLRETLMEIRRKIVLLSFPKTKRELILSYRESLLEFLRLCYRIMFTKHPEYAEINKRLIEEINRQNEILRRRLEKDPKMRKRYAFFIERLGKPSKRSERKMFEEAAEVKARLVADELITDRNLLLEDLDLLFKESRKLASGREKTKLNQLYRRLHDRRRLDAYCEFLGRLTSLPREVYLVPVGFKGYIRKFIEIASTGAKMTGDKTFESWLRKTEESVYTRLRMAVSPLILRGIEKQRISDQIEED